MAWLVLFSFIVGLTIGIVCGRELGYNRFYNDVFLRIRAHVGDMYERSRDTLDERGFSDTRESWSLFMKCELYSSLLDYMDACVDTKIAEHLDEQVK